MLVSCARTQRVPSGLDATPRQSRDGVPRQAVENMALTWAVASFDGETIHLTSEESGEGLKNAKA